MTLPGLKNVPRDGVVDLLREIRDELGLMRRGQAVAPLADRALQAIHGLLGNDAFTAPDIVVLAASPLSTRGDLRAVVRDVVRGELDQAGAARKFGKFLAGNSQHEANGLRLVFIGKTRPGGSYRVEPVATETRNGWNL